MKSTEHSQSQLYLAIKMSSVLQGFYEVSEDAYYLPKILKIGRNLVVRH